MRESQNVAITPDLVASLTAVVGPSHARLDAAALDTYGRDALQIGHRPDIVLFPGTTREIAAIARLCNDQRLPLVVRGAGTGYTRRCRSPPRRRAALDGAVYPIIEIDEDNLLAVVQANVITHDLQQAVEARGLFYPPDPPA